MSVLVKKSFAWIWMAALLTATMGVSVHQIYCYCAGMGSASIFSIQDECSSKPSDEAATPSCCANKAPARPSCCEKSGAENTNKRHGCTEKTTKVFQLKPDIILTESDFGKIVHAPADLPPAPVFIFHSDQFLPTQLVGIQSFPNPPPPLSGRMVCVRHCIALC